MDSGVNYAHSGLQLILVKIYMKDEADKEKKNYGFIKISLPEDNDAEGFVKFEVGLPNIELLMIDKKKYGYEIISVWQSEIQSGQSWFTDSNGLELLERHKVGGTAE